MSKRRLPFISLISILFLTGLIYISLYYLKSPLLGELVYDLFHNNKSVNKYNDARNVLSAYPKLTYSDLPSHIKHRFSARTEGYIYIIPENDLYKKICFNNRINSFLSREERIVRYHFLSQEKKYLYIDDQLLHTFFQLSDRLTALGYNASSIQIRSAYRSKSHNERVGGARNSQHLKGKALDLHVGDINGDQKINSADKKIVSDILDKEIIRSKGGVGFYPGTMGLHMDVRGKRARWNNYSR